MVSRVFTLLDAMVFVAATAVGLAVIRTCSPVYYTWQYTPIPPPTWVNWSSVVFSHWSFYLSPLPAAWALAVLILRLRAPRPTLHRVFRQPGLVASCAVVLCVLAGVAHYLADLHRPSYHEWPFEYTTYSAGCAVGAVWLVLWLGGRWRAERSWIDRLGRGLGAYWISMVPLVIFCSFVQT
jgi:hypothetical protein